MLNYLNSFSQNYSLALSSAFTGAILLAFYIFKSRVLNIPWYKEWKYVGKVSDLYMYPLKSGRFLKLKRARCTTFGLKQFEEDERAFQMLDRFLVVYRDSDKSYCTSKTFPHMVLIEVTVHDQEYFAIDAPNMRTLYVKIPVTKEDKNNKDNIYLWGKQKVMTIDCGDEAATWVSRYILDTETGLRLGFHDGSERRSFEQDLPEYVEVYKNLKNESTGLYADLANYLFVNESSVNEVNSRLTDIQISHRNFRPNIVISDNKLPPFDEDDWEYIKINNLIFKFVKYCPRCLVVNIDVDTGSRIPGREPLNVMGSYRKLKDVKNIKLEGEHPLFGSYFDIIEGENELIEVGAAVFVKKR
ncbi:mitochondrial amidoxime reducing component 2-like isoform X2 [Agrilus planipennis]|uniref:Mitochondrial amidoxime reducing component 2-like isoform X1 n=1 Tax=Agrilus planipennis TaxID=224129 RepID=A0A7F5RLM1_AGRPL|nr:mitochondrial amidoxime reducing component 2-like isoform X1 [Agrilus planipennis]XP_025836735.1 mitochondrial amidoxime reducing component 2-like isoform X2 [Agrilus planipennis]